MVEPVPRDREAFRIDADDVHVENHVPLPGPRLADLFAVGTGELAHVPARPFLDVPERAQEKQGVLSLFVPLLLVRGAVGDEYLAGCRGDVEKEAVGVPVLLASFTNVGAETLLLGCHVLFGGPKRGR